MLNKLIIQGRIAKEFEVNTSPDGVDYVNFTLVWSEKYKEKEKTCFLKSVAYNRNAKFLEKFFSKGDMVLADGKLITDKYESKGEEKWITEFLIDKLHFPGNKNKSESVNSTKDDDDEMPLPF